MFGEKEAPLFNRLVRLLKEVLQPLETGLSDSYVRYVLRTYRVQQRNLRALNKSGAVVQYCYVSECNIADINKSKRKFSKIKIFKFS